MPIKNKKNNEGEPMDIAKFVVKFLQDSAVTIFWESVDRFKKEIKVRMEIGFQFLLGVLAILTGLVFILVGIADFLEEIIGTRGIGFILTGVFVTVAGIWVGERTKQRSDGK